MLPKEIAVVIEEIFWISGNIDFNFSSGKRRREIAQKEPEASLLSLLLQIKNDLPCVSSTLRSTVESAAFASSLAEARKLLGDQNKTEALAKSQ